MPISTGRISPGLPYRALHTLRRDVARALQHLEGADAMLIVGSSLMVYSGFRFAVAAARRGIPIAAVNLGRTRADDLLAIKIDERCEAALAFLLSSPAVRLDSK
jgi:NAD-dependent SIR2 family protein deacetylase